MDGEHVVFQIPKNSVAFYFNYKKACSIVLLTVVDANYKFTMIDFGAYGQNGDRGISLHSVFSQRFIEGKLNFSPKKSLPGTILSMPHVIVADEALPIHQNLMRPYPGIQLSGNDDKKVFNYRLSRAKNVSEDAFGIPSKKFRIYQRRLKMTPDYLDIVVLALVVYITSLETILIYSQKLVEVKNYLLTGR